MTRITKAALLSRVEALEKSLRPPGSAVEALIGVITAEGHRDAPSLSARMNTALLRIVGKNALCTVFQQPVRVALGTNRVHR